MSSILTSATAAGLLLGIAHGLTSPASAGGFVNAETNSAYFGDTREATVTDVHVGYDLSLGESATLTFQGGPAFVSIPDEDLEHELSGKIALSVDATDKLNIYGEVSAITVERSIENDFPIGLKLGAKYSF